MTIFAAILKGERKALFCMNKNHFDLKAIEALAKEIATKEGNGSIHGINTKTIPVNVPRWSTGLPDLDDILGGGMPEGRMIEIYGAESSGKTSLLYHLFSKHPVGLDIPTEGTFDSNRAKMFGNRPKQLLVYRGLSEKEKVLYGERAFNKLIVFAEKGIPLEAVDSVPYMQRKVDRDKILKAAHKDEINELRVGGVACLMNDYLPTLKDVIEITGTTVIFINQIRDSIGTFGFGEQTHTPGGHQFRHTMSIRLHVARREWIKIPNYNPVSPEKDEIIGLIMKCKTVKNKTYEPNKVCELPMIFSKGFISFSEIDTIRKELMKERREYYKKLRG